jgi:hypothetical protein
MNKIEIAERGQAIIDRLETENKDYWINIYEVKIAAEWLLKGNTLIKLAYECARGNENWSVYNFAYEINFNEKRANAVV